MEACLCVCRRGCAGTCTCANAGFSICIRKDTFVFFLCQQKSNYDDREQIIILREMENIGEGRLSAPFGLCACIFIFSLWV